MKNLILFSALLLFVTFSSKAQNSISGYVVSLETAKPISNATILLHDQYNLPLEDTVKVTSDSTGFYMITDIETGSYTINVWTTYQEMNQQFGMVLQSDIIELNRSISFDVVFSENAFKMHLHLMHNGFGFANQTKQSSNQVAFQAVRPHFYIDSERHPVGSYYVQRLNNIKH